MALAFGLHGCGGPSDVPEIIPVRGKVSYRGRPLSPGTITFQSDRGHLAVGEIQADGSFRLRTLGGRDGATAGHHRISLRAGNFDPSLMPGTSPGYKPPADVIPQKYTSPDTSGLEAEVGQGKAYVAIDLSP